MLRRLLIDALSREPGDWPRDDANERGDVLVDLLEFADALPFCGRSEEIGLAEKVIAIDEALQASERHQARLGP